MAGLERCLNSVSQQTYQGSIEHWVVGDHLPPDIEADVANLCRRYGARFRNDLRPIETAYQPVRTGRLRNLGVAESVAPLVAHLDDDNTFDADHIASLAELLSAKPALDIAFSWRRMLDEHDRPIPLYSYPWVISHRPVIAREVFDLLAAEGFFEAGSAIIRDRIPDAAGDLNHIDSSEWMMRRHVFERVRFCETATPREMIYQFSEDYLFCRDAQAAGFQFGCTEHVSLNYYLGGYGGACA
ncbi:hypothetical protein HNO93_000359 [Agrobacterium vitis]|nr:hypothetical protein [Agrobacterium vitis]